ncbi:TPA: manganese ABC transporter ATP-binding protein, partial [Listeria monocytogenes]
FHKVAAYFDDIILLNKKLVAHGPVEQTFTEEKIQFAYGDAPVTFATGV